MVLRQKDRRIESDEVCPCGTGRIYKECCFNKSFKWVRESDGTISRVVHLHLDLVEELKRTQARFKKIFGRPPGKDDPVFLGNYFESEEDTADITIAAMEKVGMNPALIYAYRKTGLMVTSDNHKIFPNKLLDEWN